MTEHVPEQIPEQIPQTRWILFQNGRPSLYIHGRKPKGSFSTVDVINGDWELRLNWDTLEGTVVKTKKTLKFSSIEPAPFGDYHAVLSTL